MSKNKQRQFGKEIGSKKSQKDSKQKVQTNVTSERNYKDHVGAILAILDRSIFFKFINVLLVALGAFASIVQVWGTGLNFFLVSIGYLMFSSFLGRSEVKIAKNNRLFLFFMLSAGGFFILLWLLYTILEKSFPVSILPFMLLIWGIPGLLLILVKLVTNKKIGLKEIFQIQPPVKIICLVSVLFITVSISLLSFQVFRESKYTIIAVSNFTYLHKDGTLVTNPVDSPISKGLENELSEIVKNDPNVRIIRIVEAYSDDIHGKDLAIKRGLKEKASIMIWGSVQETYNSNVYKVTTHFELLKHRELIDEASLNKLTCERTVNIERNQPTLPILDNDNFVITLDADKNLVGLSATVLGMIQYDEKEYSSAISYFSTAIDQLNEITNDQAPVDLDYIRFYKGNSLIYLGMYSDAVKEYEAIYSKDTSFAEGLVNMTLAIQYTGDIDRSLKLLDSFIGYYPIGLPENKYKIIYAYAFNNRGLIYKMQGNTKAAIKDFTEAINILPDYPNPYGSRGDIYLQQGNYDLAFKDFNDGIKIAPDYPCAYNDLGWGYYITKQFSKAEASYKKALRIDPSHIKARLNLAAVYISTEKYDLAKKEYENLIKYNQTSGYAFYRAAQFFTDDNLAEFDIAIDYYERAIELDYKVTDVFLGRGIAYAKSQDYFAGIQDFTKVLELDPISKDALFNRGNSYFQLGRYEEALNDYNKLIELTGNGVVPLVLRANTYIALHKDNLALIDANEAKEKCTTKEVCEEVNRILKKLEENAKP